MTIGTLIHYNDYNRVHDVALYIDGINGGDNNKIVLVYDGRDGEGIAFTIRHAKPREKEIHNIPVSK